MERIKIGISSCLLGEKVRYNGEHKLIQILKNAPAKYNIEYIPVCPEVECGLGVPRKAMHLWGNPDSPRLIVTDTGQDLTDTLLTWSQKRVIELEKEDICGFIFKCNSPSCAIRSVDVFNQRPLPVKTGTGIFAATFTRHFPFLPVENEENLNNPDLLKNFIERIFASAKHGAK